MNGEELKQEVEPWIVRFARVGYAAKGVVYVLIGWLALMAALGNGSAENTHGTFAEIASKPFGNTILALIGVGLLAYALWLAYAASANPERDKIPRRMSRGFLSLVNGSLALAAVQIGPGSSAGGGEQADAWTARVLAQPFGNLAVIAIGVGIALYGLRQLQRGTSSELDKRLRIATMPPERRRFLVNVSRAGLGARGIVFVLIGVFLVRAAFNTDPGEAIDLGGALRMLKEQSYGDVMLGIVAIGLAGYGVYELLRARYRHIGVRGHPEARRYDFDG